MREAIRAAFAKMSTLQLENTPNADDLDMTAIAWVDVIGKRLTPVMMAHRLDLWMQNATRWPTPSDIVNMDINRYQPPSDSPRLPHGTITPGVAEKYIVWMQENLGSASPDIGSDYDPERGGKLIRGGGRNLAARVSRRVYAILRAEVWTATG